MAPSDSSRVRPRIDRLAAAYAAVALAATALAGVLGGVEAALAAALGGGVAAAAQAWLAWRVLRRRVLASDAQGMLRALYWGEAVKLAAVAVMLLVIFRYWPGVPALPLIATFVVLQAVHWCSPLLLER